jgi:hypothetical protein
VEQFHRIKLVQSSASSFFPSLLCRCADAWAQWHPSHLYHCGVLLLVLLVLVVVVLVLLWWVPWLSLAYL